MLHPMTPPPTMTASEVFTLSPFKNENARQRQAGGHCILR
jgi:hypothetical protein